jgi:exonuclease SbcC
MFERFFKPKWQNANPAVRLDALSRFSDRDVEHQRILAELAASDPDATVSADALRRLASTETMLAVVQGMTDEKRLKEGLIEFWKRAETRLDAPAQLTAILQVLPADVRVRFARVAPLAPLAEALVDSLENDALLAAIAVDAPFASVRQRAAQAIDDEAVLEDVARQVKTRDKGVHRIVRDKLDSLRAARKSIEDVSQSVAEACAAMEQHARLPVEPLYGSRCEYLQKQWQRVAMHADAAQLSRYQAALETCRRKLVDASAPAPVVDVQDEARMEAVNERLAACLQLEEACKQLSFSTVLQPEDLPALAGLLTTQRNRWSEAGTTYAADAAERKRFKEAATALETLLNAGQRLQAAAPAIAAAAQALLDSATQRAGELADLRKALQRAAAEVRWPDGVRKPDVLDLHERALRHGEERLQVLEAEESRSVAVVEEGIVALRHEIERGNLKAAQTLLRNQQILVKNVPMRKADTLQKQLRELAARVNELRDWQGFATVPKKEALCEEMEALAGATADPEALAARIRRLQEQWKMLGGSDGEQGRVLWERFSSAADRAFEPCRAYFDNLNQVRQANLQERRQLCDQLAGYLEGTDWANADWRAARDILETARQQWRRASPVDRREGAPLQERFDVMMADLHGRIQAEYERNAGRRRRIISEAEGLLGSADLQAAIERAKQLQREWKETGTVSARDDGSLWKQFRAACDSLFARRDDARAAGQACRDRAAGEAESLCEQMEQLVASPTDDVAALQSQARLLAERFDAIENLPRESAETLRKRFRTASEALRHAVISARSAQEAGRRRAFWELLSRVDAAEAALCADSAAEPVAPDWEAFSLDAALLQALRERWASLRAADAVDLAANADRLVLLCLRLDIVAGVESPADAQARRMQFQIERFNKGEAQKDSRLPVAEFARLLQREWCAVGWVEPSERQRLTERFRSVLEAWLEE